MLTEELKDIPRKEKKLLRYAGRNKSMFVSINFSIKKIS
jgi:hypothetical protein